MSLYVFTAAFAVQNRYTFRTVAIHVYTITAVVYTPIGKRVSFFSFTAWKERASYNERQACSGQVCWC